MSASGADPRLRLLRPRSAAFVGGGIAPWALELCREGGFTGPLWHVHPTRPGALRSLAELPEAPDAAFVAVNNEATVEVVRELAARGAGGAICYAAGFAEAGRPDLEAALVEAAGGMPLLGPNCYGLLDRVGGCALWPAPCTLPRVERGVALVVQSGNLGINLTMAQRSLPIAWVVSVGNQAGLDVAECVEALLDEPELTGVGIYLEGLRDAARFERVAVRALTRGVPIAVLKAGTSELGARVAATHTSSLAGADEVYDAFLDRLGIARVASAPALLETLKALTVTGPLRGRRALVLTCSGGESALAADAAAAAGLELPQPSETARAAIAAELPWYAGVGNPLDYNTVLWGQEEALARVFAAALADPVDAALLVIDQPLDGPASVDRDIAAAISALERAASGAGVPAAVTTVVPESFPAATREAARERGTAPLQGLPEALDALGACARLGARRAAGPPVPLLGPVEGTPGALLDEHASKALLAAAGIPVPAGRLVAPEEAPAAAAALGFPVAVKLCSADLPHKADAGALRLGVADAEAVRVAVAEMLAAVGDVPLAGVLVERMAPPAVCELLVGVKHDPTFGPVVVVGSGGGLVELLGDALPLLCPLDEDEVRAALRRLRLWSRLARGDVDAAVRAILAVGALAPGLAELDVNPLLVLPRGVVAVDGLVRPLVEG